MIYHAMLIELLTHTGGVTGTLCRVQATHGPEAVARICEVKGVPEHRVYLLSEDEVAVWETGGVKVETL